MKGSIEDVRVHINPSSSLIDFIVNLPGDQPKPGNILRIREANKIKDQQKEVFEEIIPKRVLTKDQCELLKSVGSKEDLTKLYTDMAMATDIHHSNEDDQNEQTDSKDEKVDSKMQLNSGKNKKADDLLLNINDLRWIDKVIEQSRADGKCDTYLHELLAESTVILPKNQIIPRNPELEARCVKLREEQQERDYRSMTKDVDSTRQHLPEDTIAFQMKSINRQLVAVFQFVVSVITGFVFGFIGLEYMFGNLDFGFRLFMGVMCALIVALAEIYFLAKKLAEYDEPIDDLPIPKPKIKPHQD